MSDYERPSSPMKEEYDQTPLNSEDQPSVDRRDRSRSRSRSRSRTPRSRSPTPRSRSRSRSPKREARSRSRSPARRSTSRRLSVERRRRSPSRSRSRDRKRRRSITPPPRRRSRSPRRQRSPIRRNQSSSGGGGGGGREFHGTREQPEVSNILGIFGLSLRTREIDLEDVCREFGHIEKVTIVYDHRSNRSRGFGFVYFKDQENATRAREALNGIDIDGRKIRVDYSVTHRAHTPTPGEYMGERRASGYDRGDRGDRGDRYRQNRRRRERSRSPRRRYYRSRSRSRSWSR